MNNYKKRNTDAQIVYTDDIEKYFIQGLMGNPEVYVRCHTILKSKYWRDPYKKVADFVINYAEKTNTLPNVAEIKAKTGIDIEPVQLNSQQGENFLEEVEYFCRHKAMAELIYDGPDLLNNGSYGLIEQRARENMLITLQKNLGTDYFDDPVARLKRMMERKQTVSTGWKDIDDKLYGGLNRGELTFFAGGPGTGKSLFLQNLAQNWVLMGLNVVYITLELSEDLVSLRFDAMNTQMPTKQIFKNLDEVALRLSMAKKKIQNFTGKPGGLQIVKMPEAGTNVKSIEAYLKEYEIQKGYRPDALIVDYLDLLHPNNDKIDPSNAFLKDKYTSEELRSLAAQYNLLCATASQLGRTSVEAEEHNVAHIAGGISKINTADNVIAIFTSIRLREVGQYQLKFLKTRSSAGVGTKIWLKFDTETLRIVDMPMDETPAEDETISELKAGLNNKEVKVIDRSSGVATTNTVMNSIKNVRPGGLKPKTE